MSFDSSPELFCTVKGQGGAQITLEEQRGEMCDQPQLERVLAQGCEC